MKKVVTKSGITITKMLGGRSNVFLVNTGELVILVDTSPAIFRKQLLYKIRKKNINTIDYLVLTHTHFDHSGNATTIKEKYSAKIIVHQLEAEYLLTGNSPIPAGTNRFTKWVVKHLGAIATESFTYEGCNADILISNDKEQPFLHELIQIMHTPGHSSGSLSLIIDNEIALVGDTLFGTYPGSCFPPFADDVQQLMQSWKKLSDTGCSCFYPAHGGAIPRNILEKAIKKRLDNKTSDI